MRTEVITVQASDGVCRDAVFCLPDGEPPFPGVLLVHPGMGNLSREQLMDCATAEHSPGRRLVAEGHAYVAMPPLYRIDVGKQVFYALDDAEKQGVLDRIEAEKIRGKVNVQRFKGLGEMNPAQLRETTIHPDTRRLVQLTVEADDDSINVLDMLLAKKRSADRRNWLQAKGDLAEV